MIMHFSSWRKAVGFVTIQKIRWITTAPAELRDDGDCYYFSMPKLLENVSYFWIATSPQHPLGLSQ
ncbi:MAG: hypothetical protein K2Q34_04205 [Alphaproteobacteria bacterium]|nr:hypothetical protein [Alphaproteobacteria bacterium]